MTPQRISFEIDLQALPYQRRKALAREAKALRDRYETMHNRVTPYEIVAGIFGALAVALASSKRRVSPIELTFLGADSTTQWACEQARVGMADLEDPFWQQVAGRIAFRSN